MWMIVKELSRHRFLRRTEAYPNTVIPLNDRIKSELKARMEAEFPPHTRRQKKDSYSENVPNVGAARDHTRR
jgi:hypothetical protein